LPGVIKDKFPQKVGIMTSIYTTGMAIFATTASAVSIPFSENLGFGWQLSLFVWALPVVFGLILWIFIAKKSKRGASSPVFLTEKSRSGIWKSKLAWFVALFMGLQSLMFYVTIS